MVFYGFSSLMENTLNFFSKVAVNSLPNMHKFPSLELCQSIQTFPCQPNEEQILWKSLKIRRQLIFSEDCSESFSGIVKICFVFILHNKIYFRSFLNSWYLRILVPPFPLEQICANFGIHRQISVKTN